MAANPDAPVVVTAALTGARAGRLECPAIPYTPDEIAAEARRAWEAGATVVHIHAREPDGSPTDAPEVFREIERAVRAVCPALLSFPTGTADDDTTQRERTLRLVRPDLATLDMGALDRGRPVERNEHFLRGTTLPAPWSGTQRLLVAMNEAGVQPVLTCFDSGHTRAVERLRAVGLLREPHAFDFVMGAVGGMPGTVPALQLQAAEVPAGSVWHASTAGGDPWRVLGAALVLGGDVRVGLQDNFYLPDGEMARSNGELVARVVRLTRDVGRRVATLAEARALLGRQP